ncbi:hypothetical protein CDL15_Pgr026755 [Punica granatum]|uniref:Uncharacterized protein n=1 Tax=Punica granatum TaxID=22663 RepID=A0A218WLZ0_PUNGR|nr:hypothetical protein CDL15_Pgr026755 [Punica granatum]PKI53690.1 hypothetical protein CRG98_025931 [Punica granatum]
MRMELGLRPSVGDPNPPLRSHAPTEDADDHGGGVDAVDWWPLPPNRSRSRTRDPNRFGGKTPIDDSDPTLKVSGILCECMRCRW